jgi:hypothetical protein
MFFQAAANIAATSGRGTGVDKANLRAISKCLRAAARSQRAPGLPRMVGREPPQPSLPRPLVAAIGAERPERAAIEIEARGRRSASGPPAGRKRRSELSDSRTSKSVLSQPETIARLQISRARHRAAQLAAGYTLTLPSAPSIRKERPCTTTSAPTMAEFVGRPVSCTICPHREPSAVRSVPQLRGQRDGSDRVILTCSSTFLHQNYRQNQMRRPDPTAGGNPPTTAGILRISANSSAGPVSVFNPDRL